MAPQAWARVARGLSISGGRSLHWGRGLTLPLLRRYFFKGFGFYFVLPEHPIYHILTNWMSESPFIPVSPSVSIRKSMLISLTKLRADGCLTLTETLASCIYYYTLQTMQHFIACPCVCVCCCCSSSGLELQLYIDSTVTFQVSFQVDSFYSLDYTSTT